MANKTKKRFTYKNETLSSANPDDMLMYYTKEDIERYGVLGIELIKIGG